MAKDDFSPVEVGPAVTEETKAVPLISHGRNALIGAGVGLGAGGLSYWLMQRYGKKYTSDRENKKAKALRILAAAGIGVGTGALTYGIVSGIESVYGTNFSHKYVIPKTLKPGQKADFAIDFSGSQGGPWQDAAGYTNYDVVNMESRYGKNKTIHVNPFDVEYAKQVATEIHKAHPDARIRVSGHSMGAATAYEFCKWLATQGIKVDRLDTRDPVGRSTEFTGKPETTATWVNYRPSKRDWRNSADFWAIVGGKHDRSLTGSTDVVVHTDDLNDHRYIRFAPLYREGETYNEFPLDLRRYEMVQAYNKFLANQPKEQ